jgi:predicted transcriptional regulator
MTNHKRQTQLAEARRLYVQMNQTIPEVAAKMGISEQTARNWKKYDREYYGNDWDAQRADFSGEKVSGVLKDFEDFLSEFIGKARVDMEEGRDISPGRLYALKNFLPTLQQMQKQQVNPVTLPDEFQGGLDEFLQMQIEATIHQLMTEDLDGKKRVFLIKELTTIRDRMKKSDLESHMKSLDARIVAALIRKIKPDVTDDEIVKLWSEASEKVKK